MLPEDLQSGRVARRATALAMVMPLLAFAASSLADDGTLEINQACAVNGGCFQGDDEGFPVQIQQAGSYVLTGPLDLPASESGITVLSDDVTIDLNGFAISGQASCTGRPVSSCTGAGTEFGIVAQAQDNLTVRNGTVRAIEGDGVASRRGARISDVSVEGVTVNGLDVGRDAALIGVQSMLNGNVGIQVDDRSVVKGAIVEGNGSNGIAAGFRLNLSGSVVSDNGASGIILSTGSIVRNVTVGQNSGDGIQALGTGSLVAESSFVNNDDYGINCLADYTAITDSVMRINNPGGDQFTTPNCQAIGENFCTGDMNCP